MNEYLKPVYDSAVEAYKKLWPAYCITMTAENKHEGDPELSGAAQKLENMLISTFGFSWPDIVELRQAARR